MNAEVILSILLHHVMEAVVERATLHVIIVARHHLQHLGLQMVAVVAPQLVTMDVLQRVRVLALHLAVVDVRPSALLDAKVLVPLLAL